MAEIFNNFFSTVDTDLANNMPPSDGLSVTANIISNCNSMFLYPVTKSECIDVISKLTNRRTDVNSISIGMLKNFREILSLPLVKLINIFFFFFFFLRLGFFQICLKLPASHRFLNYKIQRLSLIIGQYLSFTLSAKFLSVVSLIALFLYGPFFNFVTFPVPVWFSSGVLNSTRFRGLNRIHLRCFQPKGALRVNLFGSMQGLRHC